MKKIIDINSCGDCPESSWANYELPFCDAAEKHMENYNGNIPDWCPLENADSKPETITCPVCRPREIGGYVAKYCFNCGRKVR